MCKDGCHVPFIPYRDFVPQHYSIAHNKPLPQITPDFGKVCLYFLNGGDYSLLSTNTQVQDKVEICVSREELTKEDLIFTDALLADLTLESESAKMKTREDDGCCVYYKQPEVG